MQAIRQIIDDAPETVVIPEALRHHKLEVIYRVIDEPKSGQGETGWPIGFFARTAGAWQGEPLVREAQDDFDQRLGHEHCLALQNTEA